MQLTTKLQIIALQDIGKFCAAIFVRSEDFLGQMIALASDELTMLEATTLLAARLAIPSGFNDSQMIECTQREQDDLRQMFRRLKRWRHGTDGKEGQDLLRGLGYGGVSVADIKRQIVGRN